MNITLFGALTVAHIAIVLALPILMVGVVNRTKSWWAGRKGPRLLQLGWDLARLLRKRPVVSRVTTQLFRAGPWVVLAATVLAAIVSPVLGQFAPVQFAQDFVLFAYALGLARLFLMLSAMDVGSAFEGMGAAREASFTTFVEPALFLLLATAGIVTGQSSFASMIGQWHASPSFAVLALPALAVLFVLLQAEAARVPVDDPLTHLELTMIHEVMILDHSGSDLAAMQYSAALKMTIYAGLIASLLNPFDPTRDPAAAVAASVLVMLTVALVVGCVESLMARLRMRHVPRYLMSASAIAALTLAAGAWLARSA